MTTQQAALQRHLAQLKSLRGTHAVPPKRLAELKRWQSQRLAATYEDLSREPRYAAATRFFLDDLYGPKDFTARDDAMMRILPTMSRLLPASAVETANAAVALEALTEELDQRLAAALAPGTIDADSYASAYRATSTPGERRRQLELALAVGRRLDALVGKPLVLRTLKLMRRPATLAGLGDLQDFLERGFVAFAAMRGATEFLGVIEEREGAILRSIFSADASRRAT